MTNTRFFLLLVGVFTSGLVLAACNQRTSTGGLENLNPLNEPAADPAERTAPSALENLDLSQTRSTSEAIDQTIEAFDQELDNLELPQIDELSDEDLGL